MLRSTKKISIKSDSYQNNEGFLLAPIIDIGGLIFRVNQKIPEVIQFIRSKGGIINEVIVSGDYFIKLTGVFSITKQEIDKFLNEHPEIASKQLENLVDIPTPVSLKPFWETHYSQKIAILLQAPRQQAMFF